jgi:hypothetical protein
MKENKSGPFPVRFLIGDDETDETVNAFSHWLNKPGRVATVRVDTSTWQFIGMEMS